MAALLATFRVPEGAAPSDDLTDVCSALLAAVERGESAALFLMSRGVHYVLDPRLLALIGAGVDVSLCAMDAETERIDTDAIAALGIQLGSQHDHARLLRDADCFLSWT
ncbi:MAG TPA: hypothetical protein PKI03_20680 [Pseudomonadota bacterium]|nr:hypothetical protein [Pseudomonadota bacterium]